jgi:FMN-dependent NADH-azoreductase
MAKLLYVEASPRKELSASIGVAKAFLESYQTAHPDDTIETLDLWSHPLPEFDGATLNAKYRILYGKEHGSEEGKAWQAVVDTFNRFNEADKYLFSVPMWNFGVPYKFKHFIDVIVQPGLAFSFSPKTGYTGLVAGKPAAVVYARGGEYSEGSGAAAMDYQKPYVEAILGFMGFSEIHAVVVEPTLGAPETVEQRAAAAMEQARQLAASF